MGLPSGQDVALAMGLRPLSDDQLRVGKATTSMDYKDLPKLNEVHRDFEGKAPLWYYILAEAQHEWFERDGKAGTPVKLGMVGSRIVTETIVGLLFYDSNSFLRQAPAWNPEIGRKDRFDMAELIKYASET